MRTLFLLLLLSATAARSESLTLILPPAKGPLVLRVYSTADRFAADEGFLRELQVESGEVRLDDLPPGTYAVMVYADENRNGRLDRNFLGIPVEPLGFSGDYHPKGPPSFVRAAFTLEQEPVHWRMDLRRPLGEAGSWGLGVAAVSSRSVYRGANDDPVRVFPAISYIGERLQILGPSLRWSVADWDGLRVALLLDYRFGAYEEDDAEVLEGLGDREDTLAGGAALIWELPAGLDLSVSATHDLLGRTHATEVDLGLDRTFKAGAWRFTPGLGLVWRNANASDDAYGLPGQYAPGDTLGMQASLSVGLELSEALRLIVSGSVEWLDGRITDSPLVDEDTLVSAFAALSYSF